MKGLMSTAVAAAAAVVLATAPVGAATLKWVDQAGGGDGNDGNTEATAYATLQTAIDNSSSGDAGQRSVINVKDGTYGISGQSNSAACHGSSFPTAILINNLDYLTIQAAPGHEPVVKPVTAVEANIVSISVEESDHLVIDNIDSDQSVAQFDNWHVCNSNDLTVRNATFDGGEDGIDFNTDLTIALIEDNTFTNIFPTASGDEVLDFTDGSYTDVVIQGNRFETNYRQITIFPPAGDSASGFVIRRNFMDGTTSQEAIRLIGVNGVTIVNNVIMNSTQQGLYIDAGSSNVDVWHNTFFNNGEEEIRTKESGADIAIKNNIIYANGASAAISANTASLPGEDYNLVFNDGSGTESSQSAITTFGGSTITATDPLLVSVTPGSEDLHLSVSSPAVEAGIELGVSEDHDGNPRPAPAASSPDIGAFEQGPPPPPTLACVGFEAPFDVALTLKKKTKRAIPVKMVLEDEDGFPVTDADLVAPPVVNVLFDGVTYGEAPPDDADLLPLGMANEDNVFRFDEGAETWIYNLGTKQFGAAGVYTVTAVSGDEGEYVIDPTCSGTFERLD